MCWEPAQIVKERGNRSRRGRLPGRSVGKRRSDIPHAHIIGKIGRGSHRIRSDRPRGADSWGDWPRQRNNGIPPTAGLRRFRGGEERSGDGEDEGQGAVVGGLPDRGGRSRDSPLAAGHPSLALAKVGPSGGREPPHRKPPSRSNREGAAASLCGNSIIGRRAGFDDIVR